MSTTFGVGLPTEAHTGRMRERRLGLPIEAQRTGGRPTFAASQLRWAIFAWDSERRLEAPPGFEPGVEVLQTSALPLGDGALKRLALLRSRTIHQRASEGIAAGRPCDCREGLLTEAHALDRKRERRLERETGFEPATSTLARSHSTTELFPPGEPLNYHERTVRLKPDSTREPCAERQSPLRVPSD